MKKTAKEEQAQVSMEIISLRQSGDPKDMASATDSLPDVRILINTLKPQAAFSPSLAWRPRGSQVVREKTFEPLFTDSHQTILKQSSEY